MRRVLTILFACLVLAAIFAGTYLWRHRFVRSDADLLRYLPAGPRLTVFVDFRQLRQILPAASYRDPDFQKFVDQTGFDYEKDIDAGAAQFWGDGNAVLLLRGKFRWAALSAYARAHRGSCRTDQDCVVPTRVPGRPLSFQAIQPDVLMASLGSRTALIRNNAQLSAPTSPVFLRIPAEALRQPEALPAPLTLLASTLSAAAPLTVTVGNANAASGASFVVYLDAAAPTATVADTIRKELELQVKLVELQLARTHHKPDPASLLSFFTAGDCQAEGVKLHCSWPVSQQLLTSLQ